MSGPRMVALAQTYLSRRMGGDIDGCVALLDAKVRLDNSHGCDAGKPAIGLETVEKRLRRHPPPKLPIEWEEPNATEARTVTINGTLKQFRMTWYQRLELSFSDDEKITNIYWYGRVPVRDGEGCCV
eukprot:gene4697-7210_t